MIGRLPTTLDVAGTSYNIRTDYRDCMVILQACMDDNLTEQDKMRVILEILYVDIPPQDDLQEAVDQAIWFLNRGDTIQKPYSHSPLYDWEQDEQIIFSAINKVANKEVRDVEYMHFWTFLGLFNEIGEGTFSTVVSIRDKKQKNKKLEKWEKEFCRDNPDLVNLKRKYTETEKEELSVLDNLLGVSRKGE